MTPLEAREAVYTQWSDGWVDDNLEELTPTVLDGDAFDATPDAVTAFVTLSVREVDSVQRTMGPPGGRRFDRNDLVIVRIATAINEGRADADELAQTARGILEAVRFGGVVSQTARVRPGDVDGRWHFTTIEVPIRYSETK